MLQRSPQPLLHPATRLAALLLCLILGCLQAGAQTPLEAVTLQLKWKHAFQFAGYYAAIEQGYYADAGFDVTLQELVDARSPADFLLQEQGVGSGARGSLPRCVAERLELGAEPHG